MSEIEQFWIAICKKTGDTRNWHDLDPQHQAVFIQGVNMILAVVNYRG